MRVTIEIKGPIACGKTRLAQFLENKLRDEYSVEFVRLKKKNIPLREVYVYNIAPL